MPQADSDWVNVSSSRGGSRIFFRRGCTRLLLFFNTNKPHSFFLQNTSCIRKPQVISRGGGEAHPLQPPPRSTPAIRKNQSRMNQNSTFSSLVSDVVLEEFLVSKSSGLGEPSRLDGEGDSTEGEFRDDPLSVTVRLISSFHSRRNDASSSSSFFSSCTSS